MKTMPHRVVLFDIDGTLVRTLGAGKKAIELALKNDFDVAKPDADLDYAGRTDLSILKELFERNNLQLKDGDGEKFFRCYVRHLPESLASCKGELLPGVVPLLDYLLTDDEIIIGLLTGNIREGAFAKLNHFNIGKYFKLGGFGDNCEERIEIGKEAIKAIEDACALKVNPRKVLVVGDTPHDIACAKAIGARSLAVCNGYSSVESIEASEPTYMMETLEATNLILAILDSMDL